MNIEIKRIQAPILFPLIADLLDRGQNGKISVSGNSMYPFLRDGIDSVEITKAKYKQLGRGDIVIIQRSNGCYIMHRIYKKKLDCFFMAGDAQQWIEGPLYPNQLIAKVIAIWRRDKRISCSNRWWRLLSKLWRYLRPFRYICLKAYQKIWGLIKQTRGRKISVYPGIQSQLHRIMPFSSVVSRNTHIRLLFRQKLCYLRHSFYKR